MPQSSFSTQVFPFNSFWQVYGIGLFVVSYCRDRSLNHWLMFFMFKLLALACLLALVLFTAREMIAVDRRK